MRKRRLLAAIALLSSFALPVMAANVPRPAPDFTVNMNNGAPVRLSQYKGKVVAFIFILTTCPHCQAAIRHLTQLQNEYGARGFQVLASAIEPNAAAAVPGFVNNFKTPFPVGYNQNTADVLAFMEHPPMLIPHMPLISFIDRKGQIRAQWEGDNKLLEEGVMEKSLRDEVESLMKEGSTPGKKAASKKTK